MVDFLSPNTDLTAMLSDAFKVNTAVDTSGSKYLSPDTRLSGKFLSPDVSLQQEQAGLINLKGTLDASTKKQAYIISITNQSNSPFASASQAPQNDVLGALGGTNNILPIALLGVGALFIFSGGKK